MDTDDSRQAEGRQRKERVLHTRISERLDETLRRAADELRVPVSNLVRNVLEDAFVVVETVAENVGELVDDVIEEAGRVRGEFQRRARRHGHYRRSHRAPVREVRPEFSEVMGWQPLILNAEQHCADCGRELRRGERGYLGMRAEGQSRTYLCRSCLLAREAMWDDLSAE